MMRAEKAADFLRFHGWEQATHFFLPSDASRRRYTRLINPDGRQAMFMDMPIHPEERFAEFLQVARHLNNLGIRGPEIYAADDVEGFALLEDLGDQTITSQLAAGVDPAPLYRAAVDILIQLHTQPTAANINVAPFDHAFLHDEMMRFIDWRWPYFKGEQVPAPIRTEFAQLVSDLLNHIPVTPQTLVLRDYHAANLMVLTSPLKKQNLILISGASRVSKDAHLADSAKASFDKNATHSTQDEAGIKLAVIDFQDAQIGHPAYDLVMLLQDARLDIPTALATELYEYYLQKTGFERVSFDQAYLIFAAQLHGRLLGQFIRLKLRDGKDGYLKYLPRSQQHFENSLCNPLLHQIAVFIRRNKLL